MGLSVVMMVLLLLWVYHCHDAVVTMGLSIVHDGVTFMGLYVTMMLLLLLWVYMLS